MKSVTQNRESPHLLQQLELSPSVHLLVFSVVGFIVMIYDLNFIRFAFSQYKNWLMLKMLLLEFIH
jgi:hypothetical protein